MMEWQPIETAPLDGSYVIVDLNGKVGPAFYEKSTSKKSEKKGLPVGWVWIDECDQYVYGKEIFPTHWMPFPSPVVDINSEQAKEQA
jgi:hypothetical protein